MRALRRLLAISLLGLVFLASLVAGSMLLSPTCADLAPAEGRYDVAIVLSRGSDGDGGMDPGTADRTEAGIDLYENGVAGSLLMTGDALAGPEGIADVMRERAVEAGVPADRVLVEPASRSTLENARFSLPLVEPDARIILVTEGFHLWRGWASFAWAGRVPDGICQSSPLAGASLAEANRHLPREVAAWAMNIARASAFSAADALGQENRLPEGFLE